MIIVIKTPKLQKKVAGLKENKVDLKNGWHMWRSYRWSWIFQHFLLYIKILTYRFTDLSPLIWINENL